MVIAVILMMFLLFYLWAKFGAFGAFAIIIVSIVLLAFIAAELEDRARKKRQKMLEDDSISEDVKQKLRTEIRLEREKLINEANAVKISSDINYIGGHEIYSNMKKGKLYLYDDRIDFYSSEIFGNESERNVPLFSIPMNEVSTIAYDLSENISLSRFIMLGLASFVFKKKTYYLIIRYVNRVGVENEVVFETGGIKDQTLFNVLNILRNKSKLYLKNTLR